jgi:hypothetical protein
VRTTLLHESGQSVAETIYLPVPQQTPQAFGSAITYARRYSLQSLVTLPSEDDDGERASEPEKENAHRVEKRPNTPTQQTKDAFAELSEPQQKSLHNMATAIIDLHVNKEPMVTYINAHLAEGEHEMRMALWSLLPSDVRAAIKKEQAHKLKPNGQFTPAELGGQA